MKRSYSNLSVIIIIGDCALWRKKEEERERNEHERVVYFVKLNVLICEWNVLFLTDRNVKGAYTCQGTGVSVDPRNVPHISFLNWFKSNLTRLSDK